MTSVLEAENPVDLVVISGDMVSGWMSWELDDEEAKDWFQKRCGSVLLFSVVQCCSVLFSVIQCCSVLFSVIQCCSVDDKEAKDWLQTTCGSELSVFCLGDRICIKVGICPYYEMFE
jgi:hypothetical protein